MVNNLSSPHYKTTKFLIQSNIYPIYPFHPQTQFLPLKHLPLLRSYYGGNKVDYFIIPKIPSYRNSRKGYKCKFSGNVKACAKESPYQVLGVSNKASVNDIKRAYRKLALKYHPDVCKEPNAQEKFMRIKHAYNTLLNSDSRKRYDSGSRASDSSYSAPGRSSSTQEEEEFYGFGDFFKDLQEEFQSWETNASSQGKPKSLWEELADIGEDFVEFLEKELNITDEETDAKQPGRDSFGGNNVYSQADEGSGIKESIDEIEASLAKLKKELGL